MQSSTKIILILALLLLSGYGIYFFQTKSTRPHQVDLPLQTDQKKMVKKTDAVTIDVTFPQIPGEGKEEASTNTFIYDEISKRIAAFEMDAVENMKNLTDLPTDIKSTVMGSPSIEEKNERYVSLFMGIEWYLRGSAHPSHSIDTYVYDYQQKRLVEVPQFFIGGTDYLKVLSALSKEDLLRQSRQGDMGYIYDEKMVADGTAPQRENFSKILPTKDGLVIYFDEYQVAPYAAGPQQVVIPYSKLESIINSNGVLSGYIQ